MVSSFCSEARGFAHYCENTNIFQLICQVESFTLIYYITGPQFDIDAADADLGDADPGENHGDQGEDPEPESDHGYDH